MDAVDCDTPPKTDVADVGLDPPNKELAAAFDDDWAPPPKTESFVAEVVIDPPPKMEPVVVVVVEASHVASTIDLEEDASLLTVDVDVEVGFAIALNIEFFEDEGRPPPPKIEPEDCTSLASKIEVLDGALSDTEGDGVIVETVLLDNPPNTLEDLSFAFEISGTDSFVATVDGVTSVLAPPKTESPPDDVDLPTPPNTVPEVADGVPTPNTVGLA